MTVVILLLAGFGSFSTMFLGGGGRWARLPPPSSTFPRPTPSKPILKVEGADSV